MGRYYQGDIEGKFWFGVQSSNSADRFGVTGYVPDYLEYYFEESNIPGIEDELKRIEKALGEDLKKMEDFFSNHVSYNDEMLEREGIDASKLGKYADYKLGKQILECIKENGCCQFTAEL